LNKKFTSFEERAVSSKFKTNYLSDSLTEDNAIDILFKTDLKSLWAYYKVSFSIFFGNCQGCYLVYDMLLWERLSFSTLKFFNFDIF
jgi:hypothetical protein